MRNFLDDYISSLNLGNKRRASSILESAKIDKTQLSSLVDRLLKRDIFANIALTVEAQDSRISGSPIRRNLRDIDVNMRDMYLMSNDISLLLDSHADILTADVGAMQKEIEALEKSVANYAFLLSDAKAYDYAYLESFSDARGEDDVDWSIPDRGHLAFDPQEKAHINLAEGMLTLSEELNAPAPLTGSIVKSNFSGFVTSDTGIQNSTNSTVTTGWRIAASTPSPVNATLKDFVTLQGQSEWSGALMVLEYTLADPAPCDTIKIESFADSTFEIVQAKLYTSLSTNDSVDILSDPVEINGTKHLFFQMQSVARFRLYLRQESYKRTPANPIDSEVQHRNITDTAWRIDPRWLKPKKDGLTRMHMLLKAVNSNVRLKKFFTPTLPRYSFDRSPGNVSLQDLISTLRQDRASSIPWTNSTPAGRSMERLIRNVLYRNNDQLFGDMPTGSNMASYDAISRDWDNRSTKGAGIPGLKQPAMPSNPAQNISDLESDKSFRYDYNFGIRSITVGSGVRGFKGAFVSKKVPAPGDIGEVKVRVEDFNYIIQDTDRDSPVVTSIEYSVTNKSRPENEDDWLPILPSDKDYVRAERFLPNSMGEGLFRFPASLDGDVRLYKNGYLTTFDSNGFFLYGTGGQSVRGLRVPVNQYTSQDIFTVDYTPVEGSTVVNFEASGFSEVPRVSSYDEDGAGEGFTGTNGQLQITLAYEPWINYNDLTRSPVIIQLQDGTLVENITNYSGNTAQSLDPDSYQFSHSGDTIMFSQAITQSFRVYYQYLPSNVRVRIVLRANDRGFVSPKVDSIQLKAKTRKSDASHL